MRNMDRYRGIRAFFDRGSQRFGNIGLQGIRSKQQGGYFGKFKSFFKTFANIQIACLVARL